MTSNQDLSAVAPDATRPPTHFRLPSFDARTREAARRGIFIWLRQSTSTQVRNAPHSAEYQRQFGQAVANSFDLPRSMVQEYNGLGETGRRPRERHEFHRMLRDLAAGKAGVLVFADGHRATRNGEDGELLIRIGREQGVLFVCSGLALNPDVANDVIVLRMLFATAEFTAASAIDFNEFSRLTSARALRHLVQLPSPLVWGDPSDPRLRDEMARAGAPDLLPALVGASRLQVQRDGVRLIPVPFPNFDVLLSIQLRFRWLWETESTRTVFDRIVSGADGWPYPGMTPRCQGAIWTPDMAVVWKGTAHENVSRWFTRPALYGIYRTYHPYFLTSQHKKEREGRLKGLHHHRKIARLSAPLPSATTLLQLA